MSPKKTTKQKIMLIGLAAALLVAGIGVTAYVLRPGIRQPGVDNASAPGAPTPEPTPELSFGPADAENLHLTLAPNISVEILPSAKSLAEARFDAFDVSPAGSVIVCIDSKLVDMQTGEEVFQSGERARTFAFAGEALAVIDAEGQFGFYNEGKLQLLGEPPLPRARLAASSDRKQLFLVRENEDAESLTPALVSMSEGSRPEVLTGSKAAISAVSGDSIQTYYAVGSALFQLTEPGQPALVLALPDPDKTIVGLAAGGGAVYFSTDSAVYALDEGVAMPLVLGMGGDIRLIGGSLYALDQNQQRIYRIALSQRSRS